MPSNLTRSHILEVSDDATDPRLHPNKPDLGDEKEIVAHGAYFHLERMDDDVVWIGLQVDRRFLHINLYAIKRGVLKMTVWEEEHPKQ